MNSLFVLLVAILVAQYLLESTATLLTLRNLQSPPPPELHDLYDKNTRLTSIQYNRSSLILRLTRQTCSIIVMLIILTYSLFAPLDTLIRSVGFSSTVTGTIFISTLLFAQYLLNIPFTLYSTFILEARYGFNQTSLSTFIMDQFKAIFLTVLLGVPVLLSVLYVFENTYNGWIYCWLGLTFFSLLLQFIAPVWIMPLFNTFSPLSNGPYLEEVQSFLKKLDFRISGLFTMDGSKRSTKGNAFFTGFGVTRKIVLFDTLLSLLSPQEVVAVLAHEIGHFKRHHIHKMFLIRTVYTAMMFYIFSVFLEYPVFSYSAGFAEHSIYAGLISFSLFFTPIETVSASITNYISRLHEYEADLFSAQKTGVPSHLVAGLKKLSTSHLSVITQHPLEIILHYSHPPLEMRLRHLSDKSEEVNP